MAPPLDRISGKWGHDGVVFLDLRFDGVSRVTGEIMNGSPKNMAPIGTGSFNHKTGSLALAGTAHTPRTREMAAYSIAGTLRWRTLTVRAVFDGYDGVHVLTKRGVRPSWWKRSPLRAGIQRTSIRFFRYIFGLSRPSRADNEQRMRERGESPAAFVFRDATAEDIPALSKLHVTAWNATYHPMGIRGPTVDVREWQWRERFAQIDGRWFCVVVEAPDGRLVGFVHGRIEADRCGDLNKIYLLPEYYRLGLGRRMVGHAARRFIEAGLQRMTLGCDPRNPSCGFYERLGATLGRDHRGVIDYSRYNWTDLPALAERCPIE